MFSLFFPFKSLFVQRLPCRKIGQGHPKVMAYTNYDGPESPMLHTKFQCNRSTGSREVFIIYGHGGHLGNVILTFIQTLVPPT